MTKTHLRSIRGKQLLSVIVAFAFCLPSLSFAPPENVTHLIVWHKDGSFVVFNLTESPKVSYTNDNVLIQSSTTTEFPFQAIQKMTYGDGEEILTDVENLEKTQQKPFVNYGNTITFQPSDNDLHVWIALMNGMVLEDFVVRKGNSSTLSLEAMKAKVFLMNVNGVTYKIMAK